MSKHEQVLIQSLVASGTIGVALGTLLKRQNKNSAVLGGIALAAILASVEAREKAQETNIPLIIEEDNSLYEVYPDGTKRLIKHLGHSEKTLHKKFTL